jgi:hypothetical protein
MNKLLITIATVLSILSALLVPAVVHADACDDLKKQFANANASDLAQQFPQYCSEGAVYARVTAVLYTFIGVAAVVAFVYGGYLYMLAGPNEAQKKKGLEVLKWAIIGVIVVVIAALAVNLLIKLVVDNTIF